MLEKEKIQSTVVRVNPNTSLIKINMNRLKFIIKRQILLHWMNKPTNKHQFRYGLFTNPHERKQKVESK